MFHIRLRIWIFILVPVHIRYRIWKVGLYTMSYMDVRADDTSSISDCLNSRKLDKKKEGKPRLERRI